MPEKRKTNRRVEKNWGSVISWKFLEEHLKVVRKLSVPEGSKVKECEDQEEAIGFC